MSLKLVFNDSKIFRFSANPSSGQTTASTTSGTAVNLVDVEVEFDYDAELGDELTIRLLFNIFMSGLYNFWSVDCIFK